jgi:membrane-bound metal-dependent hydrolase YbcI (DUF457 family)
MPVLGHALVGLGIGMAIRPATRSRSKTAAVEARSPLWLPAVVTISYLPDIVTQVSLIVGWSDGRLLGHSAVFAVAVAPAAAAVLMRLTAVPFVRSFIVALLSLLVHDVLDVMQATDSTPWWPLSDRHVGIDLALLPTDSVHEAAMFSALLIVFLALRHVMQRRAAREALDLSMSSKGHARQVWLGRASIAAIVFTAALTHQLRDVREAQLEAGRALIGDGAYQAALDALAGAERWPSTAKSGRVDHLRGEAYAGMDDRQSAELHYLRAHRADPGYVWTVADLAVFYASSSHPLADRRRLAAPYVGMLCTTFAAHRALPEILARVERKLETSRPGTPGSPQPLRTHLARRSPATARPSSCAP